MNVVATRGVRPASVSEGSPAPAKAGGPPRLDAGYESLGVEALAALLAVESAQEQRATMRLCQREARESQLAALAAQAESQHARADATRSEGLLQGAVQIAGGVLTVASATLGPSASAKNNDEWLRADARLPGADARWVSAAGRYGDWVQSTERQAKVVEAAGSTVSALARPVAQASAGAAALHHEAEASAHGVTAKAQENAASDYESLAREAAASADKLRQLLAAVVQERAALARTLVRAG